MTGTDVMISLADIAEFDISGMQGKIFGEKLPKMFGQFECVSSEMKDRKGEKEGKGFMHISEWKLLECNKLILDKDDLPSVPEDWVGKSHNEIKFITVANSDTMEFFIGFLQQCGINTRTQGLTFKQKYDSLVGVRISAQIIHRKDPDNSDVTYSSFDRIKLLGRMEPPAV